MNKKPPSLALQRAIDYAIRVHSDCNHMYDEYLPYEFHLRMVYNVGLRFIHLIPEADRDSVLAGNWNHDNIEDTTENYNEVLKNTDKMCAEIVRACTNLGRGRTREERMPDWIYQDIKETPYATFVKLCDRIANVQYSKMTGSSMFDKYHKEHKHFKDMLFSNQLVEMWDYIEEIFNSKN